MFAARCAMLFLTSVPHSSSSLSISPRNWIPWSLHCVPSFSACVMNSIASPGRSRGMSVAFVAEAITDEVKERLFTLSSTVSALRHL